MQELRFGVRIIEYHRRREAAKKRGHRLRREAGEGESLLRFLYVQKLLLIAHLHQERNVEWRIRRLAHRERERAVVVRALAIECRRAGNVVPALELREVDAGGILH